MGPEPRPSQVNYYLGSEVASTRQSVYGLAVDTWNLKFAQNYLLSVGDDDLKDF